MSLPTPFLVCMFSAMTLYLCMYTGPMLYCIAINFCLEKICLFYLLFLWVKILSNLLSLVNDYIEPMAIFTTWMTNVTSWDEIFPVKNFSCTVYIHIFSNQDIVVGKKLDEDKNSTQTTPILHVTVST